MTGTGLSASAVLSEAPAFGSLMTLANFRTMDEDDPSVVIELNTAS